MIYDFFFDDLRLDFLPPFLLFFFFGTFLPDLRASESPIAIACLRLLTFLPERPLFSVPFLRFFIAPSTFLDAPLEYFLAITFSPGCGRKIICAVEESSICVWVYAVSCPRRSAARSISRSGALQSRG